MSYKTCADCGCRVYDGFCQNCDEAAIIMQQHIQEPCVKLSDEFKKEAEEANKRAARRRLLG